MARPPLLPTRPATVLRCLGSAAMLLLPLAACELVTGADEPEGPPPLSSIHDVVPAPLRVSAAADTFTLSPDAVLSVEPWLPGTARVAELLAERLRGATGYALPVRAAAAGGAAADTATGGLRLQLEPDSTLGEEGYRLVLTRDRVTLSARTPAGLFRGTQTLRQLFPWTVEHARAGPGPWRLPTGTIDDRPAYAWRGGMLDVARHFFGVDVVKRYIDVLAYYRMNRLHLHLTDDQGWRLMIRSWPRLATVGGRTASGGGSGGYYTQDDFRELVRYAAERHIVVVPEIEIPAHSNAARVAYGVLNCDGVASRPYTGPALAEGMLCLDKPEVFAFLEDVIGEVAALTPGPYLHMGGDEAYGADPAGYGRLMRHAQRLARAHGKTLIGWEEVGAAELAPGALVQYWRDPRPARAALEHGADLILSPMPTAYLDAKYDASTPLGTSGAGYVSVRRAYEWDPRRLDGLPAERVHGIEAPLWTESMGKPEELFYMALPRLIGHAEIGWSAPERRGWDGYRLRLAAQGPRLQAMGLRFYASPEVPWP